MISIQTAIIIAIVLGIIFVMAAYYAGKEQGAREVAKDLKTYLQEKRRPYYEIKEFFDELCKIRRIKNLQNNKV